MKAADSDPSQRSGSFRGSRPAILRGYPSGVAAAAATCSSACTRCRNAHTDCQTLPVRGKGSGRPRRCSSGHIPSLRYAPALQRVLQATSCSRRVRWCRRCSPEHSACPGYRLSCIEDAWRWLRMCSGAESREWCVRGRRPFGFPSSVRGPGNCRVRRLATLVAVLRSRRSDGPRDASEESAAEVDTGNRHSSRSADRAAAASRHALPPPKTTRSASGLVPQATA